MKEFPHLVQMHRKYAADGLVCMTLDAEDDAPDLRARATKFLNEQGATFPNFLLKDTEQNEEKWKEKYPASTPPTVLLIDRQGKVARVDTEPKYDAIEAEVKKLLAEQ